MKKPNNILESWEDNAQEWISLLSRSGIASRKITNPAIVDCVVEYSRENILDAGCGEGWLTRVLSSKGFSVIGVDATAALIEEARSKSTNVFLQLTYEEIVNGKIIQGAPFDSIVFNYSLYGKQSTAQLLEALHNYLSRDGRLIIQTVHPNFLLQQNLPYKSQWINNVWKGLEGNFTKPHAWYAHTMEDWVGLFSITAFRISKLREVINELGMPVSIVFVLNRNSYNYPDVIDKIG